MSSLMTSNFFGFDVLVIKCINYILQSGRHPNGCYNALCRGGYVQVHKTIYPGMVYHKVSTLGKRQSTAHLLVGQVRKNKVTKLYLNI